MPRKPTGKPAGRPKKPAGEKHRNVVAIKLTDEQRSRLSELERREYSAREVLVAGMDALT